jgi:hypothetical protein
MGLLLVATQALIVFALAAAAFAVEVWAFGSAVRAPAGAFLAAGTLKKPAWVAITAAAAVIGLTAVPTPLAGGGFGGILSIASLVAALVYLVSVRPKVRGSRRPPPSGPSSGGGW